MTILDLILTPFRYIRGGFRCMSAQLHYFRGGEKIASFEEQNRRRSICETCPLREELKCGECGCFLREKTEMRDNVCPIGEW